MKNKWLQLDKATQFVKRCQNTDNVTDKAKADLTNLSQGKLKEVDVKVIADLKKRKLVMEKKVTGFYITKGPEFALEVVDKLADLTGEMIQKGTWKDLEFKAFNVNAKGKEITSGNLHPLMKVRSEFRKL